MCEHPEGVSLCVDILEKLDYSGAMRTVVFFLAVLQAVTIILMPSPACDPLPIISFSAMQLSFRPRLPGTLPSVVCDQRDSRSILRGDHKSKSNSQPWVVSEC